MELTASGGLAGGFSPGAQTPPKWLRGQQAGAGRGSGPHPRLTCHVNRTYERVFATFIYPRALHLGYMMFCLSLQLLSLCIISISLELAGSYGRFNPLVALWGHLANPLSCSINYWTLILPGYLWDHWSWPAPPGFGTVPTVSGNLRLTHSKIICSSQLYTDIVLHKQIYRTLSKKQNLIYAKLTYLL